jgi:predicted DCC family thiol-disulfide oxidoreductase YuxK
MTFPRLAKFRRYFVDQYLTVDARSLGFGRIVLALILLFDLWHRARVITLFYSNEGLIPNHMMMWRPPTQWMFSFFFILSHPDEVAVAFAICGLIYLLLLVGWRTRLMQFFALIAVMSLHSRVTLLENGGDWMLGELALWTAFLPLGRRFSVDAVLASMRARRETTAAELADRKAMDVSGSVNVVSLAVLALAMEIANAYIFNAAHKGGQTWRTGTAVHYVMHQDRMCTWLAVWIRPHMTLWLSRAMSWGALATEIVLPILLLSPVAKPAARRLAILCIVGLHLGFQLFINLGLFSFAMIGYTPFLLTGQDWTDLARFAQRRKRQLTAYFDAGCGVCFQFARLWSRLDRFGRITFRSSADLVASPESEAGAAARAITPELLARTMVVVDEVTGKTYTRADAVAQVLRAFPVGWLWSLPLRLPGLRALANWLYDRFAHRRQTISMWLGLAACRLPERPDVLAPLPAGSELAVAAAPASAVAAAPAKARAPFLLELRKFVSILREAVVLAFVITMVSETLYINAAVPKFLKHEQPLWIKRMVAYPRLIQAWSMFASDAPVTDQSMVVDAVTIDGRHVDPYSEATSRYDNPGHNEIPVRLDNDSFVFNYSGRIPNSGAYHQALTEWILAYHERTGEPNDRIVRFDAYEVDDDSPPIGETNPRNVRSHIFLSYPHR